jgi:alanyl-tRNA synthetase
VFQELFGLGTTAVHFGAQASTIDLQGALGPADARTVEERANAIVFENRELSASFEDAEAAQGSLRKPSARAGVLRIVSIAGLDRSACGGTHVARTGEIGPILLRKLERVRKGTRVEFVCGGRAVRRAAADYALLTELSHTLSTAAESLPEVVSARYAELKATAAELKDARAAHHTYRARELYEQAASGGGALRFHAEHAAGAGLDELRGLAQAYTALPRTAFAAALASPPTLLFATSEDSALPAGETLKAVLALSGGRGGGNARIAQGTVPDAAALTAAMQALSERAR